jgi:peptide subunit release factor 1 (eRF1)
LKSLGAIQEFLKTLKRTPENGLIILSGNFAEEAAVFRVFEPPAPLDKFFYRCDSKFYVDKFVALFEEQPVYFIAVVDAREFKLYSWKGTDRKLLYKHDVDIATNSRRGGFSANRYRRNRENKKALLWNTVLEKMAEMTGPSNENLILCGHSEMVKELAAARGTTYILTAHLQDDSLDSALMKDIVQEIFQREMRKSSDELKVFLDMIVREPDLCVFGKEVRIFDDKNMVKKALISRAKKQDVSALNCEVIFVDDYMLENYDGALGILYFKADS